MRELVIDASVAAKWVIEEQYSAPASDLLEGNVLHAPAHWRGEAINALWAKVLRGDLLSADAEERMLLLNRAPVVDTPIDMLMPRSFSIALAHSVTVYDSLYVALAERRDIEMVTADSKLIRRLSGDVRLTRRMLWIGDLRSR